MEFLSILLPIFGVFVLGFIGQKKFQFDIKGISTMALYLMSPFLTFRTFYNTEFDLSHLYLAVYIFALCGSLILVVYVVSFFRKYSVTETCGMILASSFMNNGNYGTPVVFLLFGAAGLDYAIMLMVLQQMVMSTIGIYFAAKGSPGSNGFQTSIQALWKMPIIYGGIAGTLLHYLHIPLGSSVMEAVNMVADAAIPTIMITLGMQLANISVKHLVKEKLSLSLTIRLAISPVIAFLLTMMLPVDEMVKQIMIVLAAMPTAANTTMLALQFNTEAEFVSSATFISTVLSLVTLPLVFWIVL
ncbi:AEC family transporter [Peribacillus saganii]|uniref:AEC family transporter n=1 Tax=Peribacillus saganii TaxID=2303992 RepID=A0A372LME7_9BACI|nr:AEC family transporter [Peribacillus saganii]RFU67711.1 AEC family transporter [Peribacillus saganii]